LSYNLQVRILGIETSCDETAAAVVEDGGRVLSNVVNSQIDIHAAFGGVVPEVAARSHIEVILPVIEQALQQASSLSRPPLSSPYLSLSSPRSPLSFPRRRESSHSPWDFIDAIAVANTPGLVGSLLIGTLTAKTLAKLKNKPLYAVDHVVAHVYANSLGLPASAIKFPILALAVSGGHTQLMIFRSHTDYEIVGQTRDDAVGEAFDKVAKVRGLPYPGGPSIAAAAENGDPNRYKLPKPVLKPLPTPSLRAQRSNPANNTGLRRLKPRNDSTPLDFSFSGLKTALLRAVQAEVGKDYTFPSNALTGLLNARQRADFAASFQQTAVDILIDKLKLAYEKYQPKSVCLAGGVSANTLLRQQAVAAFPDIFLPPAGFSTDNAAMVASRGYFQSLNEKPIDPDQIDVKPT
jgi:N6-L-threonylcarbamoyladenine synthase